MCVNPETDGIEEVFIFIRHLDGRYGELIGGNLEDINIVEIEIREE